MPDFDLDQYGVEQQLITFSLQMRAELEGKHRPFPSEIYVVFHKVVFQDLLLGHQGGRIEDLLSEDLLETCVVFAMAITLVIAFRLKN